MSVIHFYGDLGVGGFVSIFTVQIADYTESGSSFRHDLDLFLSLLRLEFMRFNAIDSNCLSKMDFLFHFYFLFSIFNNFNG